jgi:hypothetical protein
VFAILLFLFLGAPAHADTVADWNRIALDLALRSEQPLEQRLRAMATVHVAMFEALNFIDGRYRSHFVVRSPGLRGVSAEAVAAAAAHQVLADLYPAQRRPLAAALKSSLDALAAGRGSVPTGNSIAAVVRAVAPSDGAAWLLDAAALADALPAQGPVRARHEGIEEPADIYFGTSPFTWNGRVAELISTRGLSPVGAARIHALVSMAIADAYAVARESAHPCAQCIVTPAVAAILDSELGARLDLLAERSDKLDQDMGRQIGRYALQRYRPATSPAASSPAPAR